MTKITCPECGKKISLPRQLEETLKELRKEVTRWKKSYGKIWDKNYELEHGKKSPFIEVHEQ